VSGLTTTGPSDDHRASSALTDIQLKPPPERMSKMETMEQRKTRPRRSFTPEFKAEIVGLCQRGIELGSGKVRVTISVPRDLIALTPCRHWHSCPNVDGRVRPRPMLPNERASRRASSAHSKRSFALIN